MELWDKIKKSKRLIFIAGPCVIESDVLCYEVADFLKKATERLNVVFIFKASFDKANRTSIKSFRGPGIEKGMEILNGVKNKFKISVLTDIHEPWQADIVSKVVDVIQIPAFLCRQTNLIVSAVKTGKIVNIKKGQFLSPYDMKNVVAKAEEAGGRKLLLTERGASFGYNNLVADMRSIPIMKSFNYPIIFDATHSVQLPGGAGDKSGGQAEFAPVLARSAIAAGADGIFVETHPEPSKALSDGPNMIPLREIPDFLKFVVKLHKLIKAHEGN
jgi:2-dehydro-3-deoxyphosphooctonate aldolase (KDO 8-P synthase)